MSTLVLSTRDKDEHSQALVTALDFHRPRIEELGIDKSLKSVGIVLMIVPNLRSAKERVAALLAIAKAVGQIWPDAYKLLLLLLSYKYKERKPYGEDAYIVRSLYGQRGRKIQCSTISNDLDKLEAANYPEISVVSLSCETSTSRGKRFYEYLNQHARPFFKILESHTVAAGTHRFILFDYSDSNDRKIGTQNIHCPNCAAADPWPHLYFCIVQGDIDDSDRELAVELDLGDANAQREKVCFWKHDPKQNPALQPSVPVPQPEQNMSSPQKSGRKFADWFSGVDRQEGGNR